MAPCLPFSPFRSFLQLCRIQIEMAALALHGLGYFDVALRKIHEGADLAMGSKHSAMASTERKIRLRPVRAGSRRELSFRVVEAGGRERLNIGS